MSSSSSWRGQGRGGRGEGRGGRGPRGRFHSHHQYGQRQPNLQYSLHRAGNPTSHHRSWERDRDSHNNAERSRQDQYYPSSQRTQDTTSKKGTGANDDYMSKPIPPKRNRNRDPVMNSSTGTVPGSSANDTAVVPRAAAVAPAPTTVPPPPPSNAESHDPSKDANDTTEDVTMTDATEPETTKRPKLERDLIVTRENWEKVSLAQKLLSESPFETVDLNLADEIRVPKLWLDKKFKAVEDTVEEMKALIERDNDRYYDPYDSERSEESVIVGNNYGSCDRTPPGFYKFVRTLPYSILFDAGFLVVGVHADDEKNCLCPCSLRMKKWRHNMGLCEPTGLDNCGVSFKKGSPNALMDHIKKMASHENAYLHKALKLYLEKLYDKFWNELSPGVHHKGLYIAGTNDFKRAEAAEKKYLQRAINHYEAELKRKEDLLRQKEKELKELEELRESNKTLAEKVTLLEKNRATLGVTEQAKFIKIDDIDEKSLHSMKNQIACLMDMQGASIMTEEVYEPVRITTPPKISIQELFDKWFKEGTKDKTYLFRSLDNLSAKYKEGQFAYKVLCDWTVNIEVPKEVMTKGVRGVNGITAYDKGGPTRSFVTAFCEQLRDLCVYIPLNKYEKLDEPPAFSKIQTRLGKMKGTVVRGGNVTKGKQTSFKIKFEDGQEELLERAQFQVLEYPFPLFESGDGISCAIPQKDTTFENMFYNIINAIDSEYNLEVLLQKVCRYYEAIGRFIVHTMFDEKVVLLSVVMPQLLKKYFFRGISPDDGEFRYPLAELLVDIQNMEPTFTIETATGDESTFGMWQIDDEFIQKHNFHGTIKASDPITDKNFRTLAVLYILKTRDMALQHIQKGLTLGGRLQFHHIFFAVPTVVLNALYFSNPSYDINDIIKILIFIPYKNKNLEASHLSILKENHKLFQETTLPSALRILQSKDKDTLQKFIYFVTGCSYLPNFEMNPHFRIDVEFQKKKDPGALPTSHTCEKIVVFPVEVYDNNAETLASKLEKAFSFGDCFGMQ